MGDPSMKFTRSVLACGFALAFIQANPLHADDWLMGKAYKLPTEYTNQESGYFSIIEGRNGRVYVGAAKYGVNGYLIEFDPKTETSKMVLDVMKTIGSDAK